MDRNFKTLLSPTARHNVPPAPSERVIDYNNEFEVADELCGTGEFDGYADRGDAYVFELALERAQEIIMERNKLLEQRQRAVNVLAPTITKAEVKTIYVVNSSSTNTSTRTHRFSA